MSTIVITGAQSRAWASKLARAYAADGHDGRGSLPEAGHAGNKGTKKNERTSGCCRST